MINLDVSQEETRPMINLDVTESLVKADIIKELSPPPVLAEVHNVSVTSQVCNESVKTATLQDELLISESPLEVRIVNLYISFHYFFVPFCKLDPHL